MIAHKRQDTAYVHMLELAGPLGSRYLEATAYDRLQDIDEQTIGGTGKTTTHNVVGFRCLTTILLGKVFFHIGMWDNVSLSAAQHHIVRIIGFRFLLETVVAVRAKYYAV